MLYPSFSSWAALLMGCLMATSTVAQTTDCSPEWTVSFGVEHESGNLDLELVMDTASTTGFDDGLDQACAQDSAGIFVCFLAEGELYGVNHIPSQGDSAIHFTLTWSAGLDSAVMSVDLGEFPLDSASLHWMVDTVPVSLDLLADTAWMLSDSINDRVMEGVLVPDCSVPGCTDEAACNFNPEATEDDGSCDYPFFCFDCEGNCLCDEDADGVCDPFEFPGCTDPKPAIGHRCTPKRTAVAITPRMDSTATDSVSPWPMTSAEPPSPSRAARS